MKILYESSDYDISLNAIDEDILTCTFSVSCSRMDLVTITQDPIEAKDFNIAVNVLDDSRVLVRMSYTVVDNDGNSNTTNEYVVLAKGVINDDRYYTKIEFDNRYVPIDIFSDDDVLNKVKNVDGINSGLDGDTLQGITVTQNAYPGTIPASNNTGKLDKDRICYGPTINSIKYNNDIHLKSGSYSVIIDAIDPKGDNLSYQLVCSDGNVSITQDIDPKTWHITYPNYGSNTLVTFTATVISINGESDALMVNKTVLSEDAAAPPVINSISWDNESHEEDSSYIMTVNATDPQGQTISYTVTCDDPAVTVTQSGLTHIWNITYPEYDSNTTITYSILITNEDNLFNTGTNVKVISNLIIGDRGVFAGGRSTPGADGLGTVGNTSTIDYITISNTGNASDFGDLSIAKYYLSGTSNGTNDRGIIGGGFINDPSQNYLITIEYVTISTIGNSTIFANLSVSGRYMAATSNGINNRGVFGGGDNRGIVIDYVTIPTPSNASYFGNLTLFRRGLSATSNGINDRGIFIAGADSIGGAIYQAIGYITISSLSSANYFGNLIVAREGSTACSNDINSRGIIFAGYQGGGIYIRDIEYINISQSGNAHNFGDLGYRICFGFSTSNGVNNRGIYAGGSDNTNVQWNLIEYVTISNLGNAVFFGTLTLAKHTAASFSNS